MKSVFEALSRRDGAVPRDHRGLVLLALAACLNGCSGSQHAGPPPGFGGAMPPAEVGYVTLSAGSQPLVQELTGRVTAAMTADVRPQVDGIIKRRLFVEGSVVKAGQPLYEIDPRSYVAAVDQASAQLENAKAALATAQAHTERLHSLSGVEAVSKQDIDDAVAVAAEARANVHQYEANLAAARLHLEYAHVLAPIGGYIGRSVVTPGALVSSAQPNALATIQQLDPVYVDITQSSAQLLALRRALAQGQLLPSDAPARLRLEDGSDYTLPGKIQFAEVNVDPSTGEVTLRAAFPNPNRVLLPGMFVRVQVVQATAPNAVLAPQQGISRGPKGDATAMVLDRQNHVIQRDVVADHPIGGAWLVTSGLAAGDRLIVEGLSKVSPGAVVKAAPAKLGG